MTDKTLNHNDLALVDELTDDGADKSAAATDADASKGGDSADKSAEKSADKGSEKPAGKSGDLFDFDDDDGDGGKPADKDEKKAAKADAKDKPADEKPGEADDKKPADAKAGEETEEQKRERLAADAAWRDRIADKILGPLKEKLTAKKFEQRREQLINQLKRSKSMDDAVVSGILAQEKLRAGDHKRPPTDASPEDATAWRKENDVPEAQDKYEIPTVPGHTWTDKDQPTIDSFRNFAHSQGISRGLMKGLVDWQVKEQQRAAEQMNEDLRSADAEDRETCYDQIRTEFGVREFKPHMAAMKRLMEDDEVFGEGMAERIMSARYFDEESGLWRRLTSVPGIARGFIGLALDRYGEGAMPSGDGRTNNGQNRLDEIKKIMATDMDRYWREGLADEAMAIERENERRASKRAGRGVR
jgi:hypothetical protein